MYIRGYDNVGFWTKQNNDKLSLLSLTNCRYCLLSFVVIGQLYTCFVFVCIWFGGVCPQVLFSTQ